jgi:4-aminobutyrate--pyruvate transaminase
MTAHLFPFTDPVAARTTPPKEMVRADGAYVTDSTGKTYFDAVSGLWCASLGFTPDRLQRAAADQMAQLGYYHSFMGRTASVTTRLAERLVEKLPDGLDHVFFGTSGSEAVDTAIKFARYYQAGRGKPGKTRIIARERGYHGSGTVSAAATGMNYCHDGFTLPLNDILRTGSVHHFSDALPGETEVAFAARRVAELEALIEAEGAHTICAFIGEPLMGSGGIFIPPEGYWAGVQDVLRRHDILLIADEIITGFGRTGEWFGAQTFGIKPDLMTMAKQLTGAMFPLSAVAMSEAVYSGIADHAHRLGTFGHGVTYGGHPVGAAVALETLAIYDEMDLPAHVKQLGAHLAEALEPIRDLPGVGDIRCIGLIAGVEFTRDGAPDKDRARQVGEAAEADGVLFRIINNTIAISPPYISTPEEIAHICAVLARVIRRTSQ